MAWLRYCLIALLAQTPDQWPKGDLDRYTALQRGGELTKSAVSHTGMIAGTSEPLAVHAGLQVLQHGGNAADAALATSLAQVSLTAGAAISYAGIMTAVYYDAASGKVYTLNASYNTVQNEKEPLTIPGRGEHSGRTALVPGFMAGVQALHDRFGKLPFRDLFGPAIWIAENGFVVNDGVYRWIDSQKDFITRLPESRRVFTKPDGKLYGAGDLLRQPELAATLKKVAAEGSAYIYKGAWAQHLVDEVRREGGKMTMEDLAAYRAMWTDPLEVSYGDYRAVSLGPPNLGGLMTLGSLKLAEVAGLRKYGHYKDSADALFYLIQIGRMETQLAYMPPNAKAGMFPGMDTSPTAQVTEDTARRVWASIQRRMVPQPLAEKPGSGHSAGVVAVDEKGNVACVLHSLNGMLWGATGIFVDGISIPDSGAFQQRPISMAGPGVRLPEATNPVLVLKGGKPVLGSVTIGSALHSAALENLINVLDFGMDPKTAVDQPNTQGPYLGMAMNADGKPEYEKEAVSAGDFPQAVIDGVVARGQAVKVVERRMQAGYWIGIQIDGKTLKGGVTSSIPAMVEGY